MPSRVTVVAVLRDGEGRVQMVKTKAGNVLSAQQLFSLIKFGVVEAYTDSLDIEGIPMTPFRIYAKQRSFDMETKMEIKDEKALPKFRAVRKESHITTDAIGAYQNILEVLPGFEL